MLKFKDFVPTRIKKAGFLSQAQFEHFTDKVGEINEWVTENSIEIVSIETVVLPNIWDEHEEGSEDVDLATSGTNISSWHQFIRIWYK